MRHSPRVAEDRVRRWLAARGIGADERVPAAGDPLPDVRGYVRVVVYGGVPQVRTSGQPDWMRRELRLIESALANGVPCLGICLGGQLLAHALGARVAPHPGRAREVGFHTVHPVDRTAGFMARPQRMLQWHSHGFELPAGCTHLARSELFECQAFRHPSGAHALQFHPEVTPAVLRGWQRRHRDAKAAWLGPVTRWRHRLEAVRRDRAVTRWFEGFLAGWADARAGGVQAGRSVAVGERVDGAVPALVPSSPSPPRSSAGVRPPRSSSQAADQRPARRSTGSQFRSAT